MIYELAFQKGHLYIFLVLVYVHTEHGLQNLIVTHHLDCLFRLSIILLLAGDVSINPGPTTCQNMRFATTDVRYVRHKSAALSDLMLSKHIDILALTETWLSASDTSACLADICPYGFAYTITPVVQVGVVESHFLYLKYIKYKLFIHLTTKALR